MPEQFSLSREGKITLTFVDTTMNTVFEFQDCPPNSSTDDFLPSSEPMRCNPSTIPQSPDRIRATIEATEVPVLFSQEATVPASRHDESLYCCPADLQSSPHGSTIPVLRSRDADDECENIAGRAIQCWDQQSDPWESPYPASSCLQGEGEIDTTPSACEGMSVVFSPGNSTMQDTDDGASDGAPSNRLIKQKDSSSSGTADTYAQLIGRAMLNAQEYKMTLHELYQWFEENTDKPYNPLRQGWRNSVRHNLSMNAAFLKVPLSSGSEGSKKGFAWKLTAEAIADGISATTKYRRARARRRRGKRSVTISHTQRRRERQRALVPHYLPSGVGQLHSRESTTEGIDYEINTEMPALDSSPHDHVDGTLSMSPNSNSIGWNDIVGVADNFTVAAFLYHKYGPWSDECPEFGCYVATAISSCVD